MSIAIVKIDDSNLNMFKKLMKALDAKVSILKNSNNSKKQMLKLIEESDETENISSDDAKKYFLKYGIKL